MSHPFVDENEKLHEVLFGNINMDKKEFIFSPSSIKTYI
jgi:hypothetical protein